MGQNNKAVTAGNGGWFGRRLQSMREPWIVLGILAGLLGVFYFNFLLGRSYLWEDLLYMAHPAFNYLSTSVAAGRFPLWLSGVRDGIPFFSEPWVYYPPTLALSLFVVDGKLSSVAIQWYLVAHFLLGGFFMYLFLRENKLSLWGNLAGTVVFVFSAFLSLHIIHSGMGSAFLWLPLELLFVKRIVEGRRPVRNFIYLALGIEMSFLAGFPQAVLYNAYFLGAYWIFLFLRGWEKGNAWVSWRLAGRVSVEIVKIGVIFLGVALLGMVVILSTIESWGLSFREQFGFADIADLSLPWYYLIHGLVPNFFGMSNGDGSGVPFWGFNRDTVGFRTWHGGYWMYFDFAFYAGQFALIAVAALAFNFRKLWAERREMAFFLFALIPILWLMLGRYGGLFNVFYHIAPGFSLFRSPSRIACLLDFSLAVLVAVVVDFLIEKKDSFRLKRPVLVLASLYGALLLVIFMAGNVLFPELMEPVYWSYAFRQTMVSMMFCGLMLAGVWFVGRLDSRRARIMVAGVLILLVFADFYMAFSHFHQGRTKPEDYYADRNGIMPRLQEMRDRTGPFRFAQLRDGRISEEIVFPRNTGYLYPGYEALEGYLLFTLKELNGFYGITNEAVQLAIQNVGVVANLDSRSGRLGLAVYTNSLPRAKFYHAVQAYPDTKSIYSDLGSGRVDYRNAVGLLRDDCEKYGIATSVPPAPVEAEVRFSPKTPEEYQISYRTTAPGIIFVSESFYPGWEADGGKYPIVRAFGVFKGIVVREPGQGVITVRFSPWTFKVGLAISLATLTGLMGVWGWMGWMRQRTKRPDDGG